MVAIFPYCSIAPETSIVLKKTVNMHWKKRLSFGLFSIKPCRKNPEKMPLISLRICVLWMAILLHMGFSGCKEVAFKTKPSDYFTASQEASIKLELVRKTARKPEGNPGPMEVDAYYQEQLKTCQWHYTHEKNGGFFFFISRPAPSLYGKRTGIGGFFTSPDHMAIQGFKEYFHTFKMKPEDLESRGAILFEKMVNGEDLRPYYHNRNSDKESWIEFPDDLVQYDSSAQEWKIREQPVPQNH